MPTRRTSVLVVEDEVLISRLIAEVLSENGFAVHAVAAAEEALRYLEVGADVDVLFTDINLAGPHGRFDAGAGGARAAARIAGGLLLRALFTLRAGAAGVALDFVAEALRSGRSVPAAACG